MAIPTYNPWANSSGLTPTGMNDIGRGSGLFPQAQASPNMTVAVSAGRIYFQSGYYYDYAGGNSPAITAPGANPYIALLTLETSGTLAWTYGAEAASPVAPTYPTGKYPICEVYCTVAMAHIDNADDSTNGYIKTDARPFAQYNTLIGQISANLKWSHDAEVSHQTTSYTKKKTITLAHGFVGSIRMMVDLKGNDGSSTTCYAKLYKQEPGGSSVAIGAELSDADSVYSTYTDDSVVNVTWPAGTQLQLYVKGSNVTSPVYAQNWRIYFDMVPTTYTTSTP